MFPRSVLRRFFSRITTVVGWHFITWKAYASKESNALPAGDPLVWQSCAISAYLNFSGLVTVFIICLGLLADGKAVPVSHTIKCSPFIPHPSKVVQNDSILQYFKSRYKLGLLIYTG